MNEKTLMAFVSGLMAGTALSLLLAPIKGSDLRNILRKRHGNNDEGGIHNFNISELISENSVSLQEIKEHLQD